MNNYKLTATSESTVVAVTLKAEDALDAFSQLVSIANLGTNYSINIQFLGTAA